MKVCYRPSYLHNSYCLFGSREVFPMCIIYMQFCLTSCLEKMNLDCLNIYPPNLQVSRPCFKLLIVVSMVQWNPNDRGRHSWVVIGTWQKTKNWSCGYNPQTCQEFFNPWLQNINKAPSVSLIDVCSDHRLLYWRVDRTLTSDDSILHKIIIIQIILTEGIFQTDFLQFWDEKLYPQMKESVPKTLVAIWLIQYLNLRIF